MFILFPIGRKADLVKFPYITAALITLNILIFVLTWGQERRFLHDRVSTQEFVKLGRQLAGIALQADSGIPEPVKTRIRQELAAPEFPALSADDIFRDITDRNIYISPKAQYRWEMLYPRYTAFRASMKNETYDHRSLYLDLAYYPKGALFPGIVTSQFLHSGILHLLFNMIFLWLVGCNLEERWGPYHFCILYLLGGSAACLAQGAMYPALDTPLIGASGAVSSIMGAFLIRFARMRIRFFYAYLILGARWGTFLMPAWLALPLWFGQQLFFGLMTAHRTPLIGYWAHIGGFVFGFVCAAFIKILHLADTWEKKAEDAPRSVDAKVDRGYQQVYQGYLDNAEKIFNEALSVFPEHIKGLKGLLNVYEKKNDGLRYTTIAARLIPSLIKINDLVQAHTILSTTRNRSENQRLDETLLFQLASTSERLRRFHDAVYYYRRIIKECAAGSFMPKALFATGKLLITELDKEEEGRQYMACLLVPPYNTAWSSAAKEYLDKKV